MPFDPHSPLAAAALHASRHGVLVLDPEGVVVACNPAAAALLDRPTEELEGAPFPLLPATPGLHRVPLPDGGVRTVENDTA